MKYLIVKKLLESKQIQKFDLLINPFIPIKRARLIYRAFGVIVVN